MKEKYYHFINQPADDITYQSVNPTQESKSASELVSNSGLDDEVLKLIGEEWDFTHGYQDLAESGDPMDQQKLQYTKCVKYLQFVGYQSQDKERSVAERQIWADAFTELSIEIYGAPDPEIAKIIDAGKSSELIEKYRPVIAQVKDYLLTKYESVYTALDLDDKSSDISAEETFEVFTRGLGALKANDPRWADWQVVVHKGAVIECDSANKEIIIGDNRISDKPNRLKDLFTHEVLVHANRAVNAEKLGIFSAMPRYLAAEEGLAKLCGFSISGENLEENMQNYTDIAYALGMLDGKRHTREEVYERKLSRKKTVDDKAIKTAKNSAARIFRGTPGSDEVSGIFTKDVSNIGGFFPVTKFIETNLEDGKSIDEVMKYLLLAKFDPNNMEHTGYLNAKINECQNANIK